MARVVKIRLRITFISSAAARSSPKSVLGPHTPHHLGWKDEVSPPPRHRHSRSPPRPLSRGAWWTRGAMAHLPFRQRRRAAEHTTPSSISVHGRPSRPSPHSPSPPKSNPSPAKPSGSPTTTSIRPSRSPSARPPSKPTPSPATPSPPSKKSPSSRPSSKKIRPKSTPLPPHSSNPTAPSPTPTTSTSPKPSSSSTTTSSADANEQLARLSGDKRRSDPAGTHRPQCSHEEVRLPGQRRPDRHPLLHASRHSRRPHLLMVRSAHPHGPAPPGQSRHRRRRCPLSPNFTTTSKSKPPPPRPRSTHPTLNPTPQKPVSPA